MQRQFLAPALFFVIVLVWSFIGLYTRTGASLPRLLTLAAAAFAAGALVMRAVRA
jgi:hypothetical protein